MSAIYTYTISPKSKINDLFSSSMEPFLFSFKICTSGRCCNPNDSDWFHRKPEKWNFYDDEAFGYWSLHFEEDRFFSFLFIVIAPTYINHCGVSQSGQMIHFLQWHAVPFERSNQQSWNTFRFRPLEFRKYPRWLPTFFVLMNKSGSALRYLERVMTVLNALMSFIAN